MYDQLAIFLISLVVLLKASEVVLRESLKTAKFLGISEFAVGFLFISIFTSLPELVVSIEASLAGSGALAVGNIIGSNIANILLILGLSAIFTTVAVKKRQLVLNAKIFILLSIVPIIAISFGTLGMSYGIVFISIFIVYCLYVLEERVTIDGAGNNIKEILRTLALFFGSMLIVVISAVFVVSSSISLATIIGVSEGFIGITLIAIGTSLPELAVSLAALRKKHVGIAVGNVLGSCVVNVTLILGVVGLLSTVTISLVEFGFAIFTCIIASLVLLVILAKDKELPAIAGGLFIAFYVLFLFLQFLLESVV